MGPCLGDLCCNFELWYNFDRLPSPTIHYIWKNYSQIVSFFFFSFKNVGTLYKDTLVQRSYECYSERNVYAYFAQAITPGQSMLRGDKGQCGHFTCCTKYGCCSYAWWPIIQEAIFSWIMYMNDIINMEVKLRGFYLNVVVVSCSDSSHIIVASWSRGREFFFYFMESFEHWVP